MSQAEQAWIEVVVAAKVALADGIAAELVRSVPAARGGVQICKGSVVFWVHPPQLEDTLEDVRCCLRALQNEGWHVEGDQVRSGELAPEEEWRDAWKKFFHTTRLTRQIVVVPSWESYQPAEIDIPIYLDPGQAFGTGAHASTQLVLQELQDLADQRVSPAPKTIFDLGTGSGILAIAAAKFWPEAHIVATDIDPMSIRATRENTQKNGVGNQVSVSMTDLADIDGQFPLLLANLQAHILRELRDLLVPRLAAGAHLLLSGILTSQIRPLTAFYVETGLVQLDNIRQSTLNAEWSSARLRRLP